MKTEVRNLEEGNQIELVNGDIAEVNHVFIKEDKAYILMSNYRWYVYFPDEEVEVL